MRDPKTIRPFQRKHWENRRAERWTSDQRRFLEWLAIPQDFRNGPKTQKEWAEENGYAQATLTHWKALPGFMNEVKRKEAQWMVDRRPHVDEALVRTAQIVGREGDKARELFYKLSGLLIDLRHVQIDQKVRSVDELSAENVQEQLYEMFKHMIGSSFMIKEAPYGCGTDIQPFAASCELDGHKPLFTRVLSHIFGENVDLVTMSSE